MSFKKSSALMLLCLLAVSSPAGAEVNIEASIRPAQVAVGEPFQLTVVVSGAGTGIKQPKLPDFEYFRSYSQGHSEEISFVNGGA